MVYLLPGDQEITGLLLSPTETNICYQMVSKSLVVRG